MQINKLKKSLKFLYIIKTGFDIPFFFVQEKQDSCDTPTSFNVSKTLAKNFFNFPVFENIQFKYPVRVTFMTTLQDFFQLQVLPVFLSFKEFVIVKDVEVIKPAISGLNILCNNETFLKQDKEFMVYERFQFLKA